MVGLGDSPRTLRVGGWEEEPFIEPVTYHWCTHLALFEPANVAQGVPSVGTCSTVDMPLVKNLS